MYKYVLMYVYAYLKMNKKNLMKQIFGTKSIRLSMLMARFFKFFIHSERSLQLLKFPSFFRILEALCIF